MTCDRSQRAARNPKKLDSYRPIQTFENITECLVTNRIRYEAETRRLLSDIQAGFRIGRSTEDQLLRLSQSIRDSFQCSPMKRTIMTLIDYLRAYDCVWWDALLLKMLRKGSRVIRVSPRTQKCSSISQHGTNPPGFVPHSYHPPPPSLSPLNQP